MTRNELILLIGLSVIVFIPMGWMAYHMHKLNQWVDKVDKQSVLLDKRVTYPYPKTPEPPRPKKKSEGK
jgi:hypothetical protein